MEENLEPINKSNNEKFEATDESYSAEKKVFKSETINKKDTDTNKNTDTNKDTDTNKNKNIDNSINKLASKVEIKSEIDSPEKIISKPKKELPVEKKPFQEFINNHLIPAFIEEINQRGFEIDNINLKNTNRPIAGDKCWVIICEIKNTCSFWLSFEKEDISSLKSISLSKPNQKPSIIESFLIDEKRITLKLIISRVLQRLNGQKLIGVN